MSLPEKCERVGDWLEIAPWRTRSVSLLLIPESGVPVQADGIASKQLLIWRDGAMFVLWHGERYTEARVILEEDRTRVLHALE